MRPGRQPESANADDVVSHRASRRTQGTANDNNETVLRATFVRRRQGKDRVYVVRRDATTAHWDFPSYGEGLPHDLCHLVVEDGLDLPDGFWGQIDQHVDVRLIDNQATLVRDGRRLLEEPGIEFAGLRRAEEAVAALASPFSDVDAARAIAPGETVTAITDRLRELGAQWRALEDGGAITLVFDPRGHEPMSRDIPTVGQI